MVKRIKPREDAPLPPPPPEETPEAPKKSKKKPRLPCGFCSSVNKNAAHELCPVVIRNADQSAPDKIWRCICAEQNPELHPRTRGMK